VSDGEKHGTPSIWWWAFGYFAAYAPYAALAKAVSAGMIKTGAKPPSGIELLPSSVMATVVTAFAFLIFTGWWRAAGRVRIGRFDVPCPSWITLWSGMCASGIIATTTLAYTFEGTSIVLVQLLLRGGVLVIAPLVDLITRRKVQWYSWLGFALSLAGLLYPFAVERSFLISAWCALDVGLYVMCYFVRLQLMSRRAKSADPNANLRYFVEEQLVSSPALLVALVIAALLGNHELVAGFTTFFDRPIWQTGLIIGVLSQGTGIFGGLILLDRRENTFCVPVNRASSILAGLVGSIGLAVWLDAKMPKTPELVGAALMVGAILALTIPPALARRRARAAAA
jgi:drug/metabolite transporter (DMT)-like permease